MDIRWTLEASEIWKIFLDTSLKIILKQR